MSSQNGSDSSALSGGIIDFIQGLLNIEISSFLVRKLAHFGEFLVLGVLLYNWCNCYFKPSLNVLMMCIFLCVLCAVSDEIHQIYVSKRNAAIFDIIIDSCGSIVGISSLYFIIRHKNSKWYVTFILVILVRTFYIFNISKEFIKLNKTNPYVLFKTFDEIINAKDYNTDSNISVYQTIVNPIDKEFVKEIVYGVITCEDKIDSIEKKYLKEWNIERLGNT